MSSPDLSQLIQGMNAPPSPDTAKILGALGQIGLLLEILVRFQVGFTWAEIQRDLGVDLKVRTDEDTEE